MTNIKRKGLIVLLVFAVIFSQFMVIGPGSAYAASEGDKIAVLATKEVEMTSCGYTKTYNFTTSKSMMMMFPVEIRGEACTLGKVKFSLTDSAGDEVFYKVLDLRKKAYYKKWFYTGVNFLKAGKYKVTVTSLDKKDITVLFGIRGYRQSADTLSMSSSVTKRSNNWVKLGKITNGLPYLASTSSSDRSIVRNIYADKSGNVYGWCRAKGEAKVTIKLKNGKTATTTVTVKAGDPDFYAYLTKYNKTGNYFEARIKNVAAADLIVYKEGEILNFMTNDKEGDIKTGDAVTIAPGETKYVRFYSTGKKLDKKVQFYVLNNLKFKYEGVRYLWTAYDSGAWFKRTPGATSGFTTYRDNSDFEIFKYGYK